MSAEEEYSEEEEISIEEKTAIVRYFIANAPPGHTDKVIEASKVLGAGDVLTTENVKSFMREYNLANLKPVQLPDGSNVVISPNTEVADGEFVQPSTGKVVTFDHVTGAVGDVRDAAEGENAPDANRDNLQKELDGYLAKVYNAGDSAVTVTAADGAISIAISAEKIKHAGGCWSGRWKSEWVLKNGSLDGTVSVMAHYYEAGNVQMHTLKDIALKADPSDAAGVVKQIEKSENDLHKALVKMYHTMGQTTFKELRRQLPVAGVKFNWSNSGVATMRQVLNN